MRKGLRLGAAMLAAASAVLVAGCSGSGGGNADEVTLRLWDENLAKAYETSIEAFNEEHPDITVHVETVPWSDYFSNLRQDVAAGNGPDIFWLNGANLTDYAKAEQIAPVADVLGEDQSGNFDPAVVEQYTLDGDLLGIPQVSDGGIALYFNTEALEKADVSAEELQDLKWAPGGEGDTLLPILQKLTLDADGNNAADPDFDANNIEQYGYNASQDLQALILPFIGSNGGTYQEGDEFTYTDPKTEEAFQYLVDLINKYHVAPPAQDTNPNGDFARDAFLQGKIAVFQSGTYNLTNVAEGAEFDWGTAPLPAGPEGAVPPSPGVVASINSASADSEAVQTVAKWFASADGDRAFGEGGSAIPAVLDARQTFEDYWDEQNVNVQPFFVEDGQEIIAPAQGEKYAEAEQAFRPILDEMFLGRTPVSDALDEANTAANDAIQG
ncbi:MAG: ABC transporter substrate-binding protein [Canibacter sp.]